LGRGGAILTELVSPFGGSYVCANFGENRSRNATVRVLADGHTDTLTHWQTQNNFIICSIVYHSIRQLPASRYGTTCRITSQLRRHSRSSDSALRLFCFRAHTLTLSLNLYTMYSSSIPVWT